MLLQFPASKSNSFGSDGDCKQKQMTGESYLPYKNYIGFTKEIKRIRWDNNYLPWGRCTRPFHPLHLINNIFISIRKSKEILVYLSINVFLSMMLNNV